MGQKLCWLSFYVQLAQFLRNFEHCMTRLKRKQVFREKFILSRKGLILDHNSYRKLFNHYFL